MEGSVPVALDPDLEYPGWERYRNIAQTELDSYNAHIRVRIYRNY